MFYDQDQIVFDVNDYCNTVSIVLQGVVEIDLINADEDTHMIDIMGRGSILGYNNVIKSE